MVSSLSFAAVTRWEPDAFGRLEQSALDLFSERGFDQTTVEDIAGRAGLTKRTFFRHFADKREVLFGRADEFKQLFLDALAGTPAAAEPLAAIAMTLQAVGAGFRDRREFAQRRQLVIAANAELQERELAKLASVAAALARALRERGLAEPAASVMADTAVAVFRNAFERWVAPAEQRELPELIRDSLEALQTVIAAS